MTELERLIAKAERIARMGERLSATFAVELLEVWRRFERRVLAEAADSTDHASAVTALRTRVRAALESAGFDEAAGVAGAVSVERMAAVVGTSGIARTALDTRLDALRALATGSLLAQGDEAAAAIWRGVVQHVLSGRPVADVVQELAAALDREMRHIRTLFDTQVSIYGRQIEALRAEFLPPTQPYLFVGPIDFKTRSFCLDHVGRVYTRARIDRLDNRQLPDVFLTGGGYNCRHSFLAVESKALRALADTGQRAPGYDAQLARLSAERASQRRRAA